MWWSKPQEYGLFAFLGTLKLSHCASVALVRVTTTYIVGEHSVQMSLAAKGRMPGRTTRSAYVTSARQKTVVQVI